jgi:hypothetical protein
MMKAAYFYAPNHMGIKEVAESTRIWSDGPASSTRLRETASAIGERQILPKQRNKNKTRMTMHSWRITLLDYGRLGAGRQVT